MAAEVLYLFVLLCVVHVNSDVLCEVGFCELYKRDPGCTVTAPECRINNATHSGIWMPSPTVCNCCEFCLAYIVEGDHCSLGGPGLGTTVGRCGPGLTCKPDGEGDTRCQRRRADRVPDVETTCHAAQDTFDARYERGDTGALEERPVCDEKGLYAPYSCVPTQSCFCQNAEGQRIFGEVLYTGATTKQNIHCGCSRLHDKITKNIKSPYPVVGPRCTSDGNFYRIQCLGRTCFCVNPVTGAALHGAGRTVDLDKRPLSRLECYDEKEDWYPEQSEGDAPYSYTTPCLQNTQEVIDLMEASEEDGFNVDFFSSVPECLPDWSFGRTTISRTGTKICVDQRGRRIGDYEASPGTPEFDKMDCKCAYTSHVIMASEVERPVCCSNGNFRPIQCRRGMCRCVDSDGRQTQRENAEPAALSCFTQGWRTC